MIRLTILIMAIAFHAGCATPSKWLDKSGMPVPDQEHIKSSENFGAQLILTTDDHAFLEDWQRPVDTVNVKAAEIVERNRPISAFIVFGGCKADSEGQCNLVARYRVYQPDGTVYSETPQMEVWADKPIPPDRTLQLGVEYLKLVIENGEPLGRYTVETIVADLHGTDSDSVTLRKEFTVVEELSVPSEPVSCPETPFRTQDELSRWVTFYYLNPDPSRVPDFLECMGRSGWLEKESATAPLFGFLAGVFRENPAEVPKWIDRFNDQEESLLRVVLLGAWYADLPESNKYVQRILDRHPALKAEFEALGKGAPLPVEQIPLEQGSWVLDVLWGNFMATGSRTPVARIMLALVWVDDPNLSRMLIGSAARWSLASNALQHERVMHMCREEMERQPDAISSVLHEIVDHVDKESEQ